MWIIILFSSKGSIRTKIAAPPEEIISVYFSSALSVLIIWDSTSTKSPILALNEEKI